MSEVYAVLSKIVGDELGADAIPIGPDTELDDIAGWDSVTLAGVLIALEGRFGVPISRENIDRIATGADLARICQGPG